MVLTPLISIDFQINNFTALSVKILDNVPPRTPYSNFSLWPCEINYLKTYKNVNIPVIASGGAGNIDDMYDVLTTGKADAALVASIVHYGTYTIRQIKDELHERGVKVRMRW